MVRFTLVLALAVVAYGVAANIGSATFDDSAPCPRGNDAEGTLLVCPKGSTGASYTLQLQGRNGCWPYSVRWELPMGGMPPGLSLSSSGQVSGTPTTSGDYKFWVWLYDVQGTNCNAKRYEIRYEIAIDPGAQPQPPPPPAPPTPPAPPAPPLMLQTATVPAATVSSPYHAQLTASPAEDHTWTVSSGALPPGLSLGGSSGLISGTPTTAGSYRFAITVSDASRRSSRREFRIDVANPLAISSLLLRGEREGKAEVGVAISGRLSATGGGGTFGWTLEAGSLPTGVGLAPDGTISGTPTAAGTYRFTAQVMDADGRSASADERLVVVPRLALRTATLRSATTSRPYSVRLKMDGGVGPFKWKLVAGGLPLGIRFQKQHATFVGKPRFAGRYRISIQVADALGLSVRKTFVLVVKVSL